MSASGHTPTPGPWEISDKNRTNVMHGKRAICSTGGYQDSSDIEGVALTNEANARLIAEAGTVAHETGLTPRQLADEVENMNKVWAAERQNAAKELSKIADSYIAQRNELLSPIKDSIEILDVLIEARENQIGGPCEVARCLRSRFKLLAAKAQQEG